MRNSLSLSAAVLAVLFSFQASLAQIRKIPAEVTTALSEKYPGAANVEWKDRLTGFTAGFELDSITYLAAFNNEGEWESTEHEIDADDLPQAVSDGLDKSKYADWEISKVDYIEMPDEAVQYRIQVGKGDIKRRNLYFNPKGRMLKDKLTL